MCGLAAILGPQAPPAAIAAMVAAQAHRGPDGKATVRMPGADLGHARLAVLDIEGGRQPMQGGDGRHWIVFNGEIYNHDALRRELAALGHVFASRSDTEVLLAAWWHWGEAALARLRGQFAFLIWNTETQDAFCARDRFGEKPFFYAQDGQGRLIAASEIKGIEASGLVSPRVDRKALECQLGLLYTPPGHSVYENIASLGPGEWLRWTGAKIERGVWWRPRLGDQKGIGLEEAARELRKRLEIAVSTQLLADVPVGAFLSGGRDSASIVGLAASDKNGLMTFSAGFGGLIDELPYAGEVARRFSTLHHEMQMDIPVAQVMETMANVYDEPFADSSCLPTYMLSGLARRHVKVVLSGDGGDELFGGYSWYAPLLEEGDSSGGRMSRALAWGAWRVVDALCRLGLPLTARRDRLREELRDLHRRAGGSDPWRLHLLRSTALGIDRSLLWGACVPYSRPLLENFRPDSALSPADQAATFDLSAYLPGDILVKVDRASMAHGLEVRAPFLDADVAEWVLALPWTLRMQPPKRLLEKAVGELWPASIRTRDKQGFGAPIQAWLERADVTALRERVTRPDGPLAVLCPGLAQAKSVFQGQAMWSLLCLGVWLDQRPQVLAANA